MQQHLFVYGTLGPNKPNAHVLEAIEGTWSKGAVTGVLKAEGWGAELGFPALILSPDGHAIHGHVFSSAQLHTLWDSLDEFEGERISARFNRSHFRKWRHPTGLCLHTERSG